MKRIKNYFLLVLIFLATARAFGTEPANSDDTTKNFSEPKISIKIPFTPVKNQNKTSTCWSFSTLSMIESELLRTRGKVYDLSEMFVVRKEYLEKADRFIRMHGNSTFAGGGEPNDVINAIARYGIVPEQVYSGLLKDSLVHSHYTLDIALRDYVEGIVRNPEKKLTENWQVGFNALLDNFLGKLPETFVFEGKKYTAESFAAALEILPQDYILLSSFAYKPLYKPFVLEVPDNWSWGEVYNVPLGEILNVVDTALKKGYSIVWSADYSEPGFNYADGLAVAPKIIYGADSKVDQKKLQKLSIDEKQKLFFDFNHPVEEIQVTPENRQAAFDNYSTTDDHGMHIIGKAVGTDGKNYYLVKNSWGTNNSCKGYLYVTEAYIQYKTISLMVNRNALPVELCAKLGL